MFLKKTIIRFYFYIFLEINEDCTPDCPCLTDLPELVVRYGDSVSLSCDPFSNGTDLSWTITWDDMLIPDKESFTMENLTDWEIQPMCQNGDQCNRTLPLTIYSKYSIHC